MNFWYPDAIYESIFNPEKVRNSKQWHRYVQKCKTAVNRDAISFPENTLSRFPFLRNPEYSHIYDFLKREQKQQTNPLGASIIASLLIHTKDEQNRINQDQPVIPASEKISETEIMQIQKEVSSHFCTYSEAAAKSINDYLGYLLSCIDLNFEEACMRRLYFLMQQNERITTENYPVLTKPNFEECRSLILLTIEFTSWDLIQLNEIENKKIWKQQYQNSLTENTQNLIQQQNEKIREQNKVIETLQKQISEYQTRFQNQQEQINHQISTVRANYKSQLKESKLSEAQLKQEIKTLKQTSENSPGKKPLPPLKPKKVLPDSETNVSVDHTLPYAFIMDGDGPTAIQLKQAYPNAKFYGNTENFKKLNKSNCAITILAIKFSSHSTILKYKNICKSQDIPFFYWGTTNISQLDNLIAQFLPSAVIHTSTAS